MSLRQSIMILAALVMVANSCSLWMGHVGNDIDFALDGRTLSCRFVDPPEAQVGWNNTADESDHGALAAACASVGPVVVRHFEPAGPPPTLDSLFVVSWNVHVGGGDIPELVRGLREGEFTGGRPLRHFVILIQEAFRGGPLVPAGGSPDFIPNRIGSSPPSGERIDIVDTAKRLHLNLFYVPSMKNGTANPGETEEDRGNAILSTLPMDDLRAIELPLERYRRVAVDVLVSGVSSSGHRWTLRVCNAHLSTRTDFPQVFQSVGVGRLRQAEALVPVLTGSNVLLGGDFNTWAPGPTENAVDYIREHFPLPAQLDGQPTVTVSALPDPRTDYLFFRLSGRATARYHRLDDPMGSDHFPLLGIVEWRPAASDEAPDRSR